MTPDADIASWTHYTLENGHIQTKLRELGVTIICNHAVKSIADGVVTLECVYVGTETNIDINAIIPVTPRQSIDDLYQELLDVSDQWSDNNVKSVTRMGDCYAPGTIVMAVYAGHQYARNLEMPVDPDALFKRENDFIADKIWESDSR